MSSKTQTKGFHGNKTEQKSGLSRHYREIGIKAVAAATRKSTALPRTRDLIGEPQKEPYANATKTSDDRQHRDGTAKASRRNRREVKGRAVLSASDQAKLQALTPQQRLAVEDALAFFPQLTLDEILSELSLLM